MKLNPSCDDAARVLMPVEKWHAFGEGNLPQAFWDVLRGHGSEELPAFEYNCQSISEICERTRFDSPDAERLFSLIRSICKQPPSLVSYRSISLLDELASSVALEDWQLAALAYRFIECLKRVKHLEHGTYADVLTKGTPVPVEAMGDFICARYGQDPLSCERPSPGTFVILPKGVDAGGASRLAVVIGMPETQWACTLALSNYRSCSVSFAALKDSTPLVPGIGYQVGHFVFYVSDVLPEETLYERLDLQTGSIVSGLSYDQTCAELCALTRG